jgi:hypothetical protein
MVTDSANFFRASSTEGASALHVPQPGAQNHNTTGFCARAFDNTNVSPLTVLATKLSGFDFGSESTPCEGVTVVTTTELVEEESAPQADSATVSINTATELFNFIVSA